eukprot:m.46354 g.46354  ORF g.46354 m.46354 type:complete len:95 (-) comp8745_c0_seq1:17-301(-)
MTLSTQKVRLTKHHLVELSGGVLGSTTKQARRQHLNSLQLPRQVVTPTRPHPVATLTMVDMKLGDMHLIRSITCHMALVMINGGDTEKIKICEN